MLKNNGMIIRRAEYDDYFGFRKMEEKAWNNTEIKPISKKMFNTWIEVFSEGFYLVERGGVICAHLYFQLCDFNPLAFNDFRNFNEITNYGYTIDTHNPAGQSLYVVSVSSIYRGSALALIEHSLILTKKMSKRFFTGACRLPGLVKYYTKKGFFQIDSEMVEVYARLVFDTLKKPETTKERVIDPVLSTFLKPDNSQICYAIKDFLPDTQSNNWAFVICHENLHY